MFNESSRNVGIGSACQEILHHLWKEPFLGMHTFWAPNHQGPINFVWWRPIFWTLDMEIRVSLLGSKIFKQLLDFWCTPLDHVFITARRQTVPVHLNTVFTSKFPICCVHDAASRLR
jgi:hypothetical protein